ncbi:MAG: prolyl oligopeptidase family serine peptidase [Myxococcota bacterium]
MTRPPLRLLLVTVFTPLAACGGARTTPDPAPSPTADHGSQPLSYPETKRQDIVDELFGVRVPDPYRWLEEPDEPEVRAWMDAQDSLAREHLGSLSGRDRLEARFRELFYIDTIHAPTLRGDRLFYQRRHADREKTVFYWKDGQDGEEHVLLDPNTISDDGSVSVGGVWPSPDGARVVYSLKENNADEATLYVMHVATDAISDVDVIPGAKYASPSWTPEGDGFYYVHLPTDPSIPADERPGHAVARRHVLGTSAAEDPVVHEATGDPSTFLGVELSPDGRWLLATVSHGWDSTDVYYRDLEADDVAWRPLVTGTEHRYIVNAWEDTFFVTTDEGAPNWRVLAAPAEDPARESWREVVPESDERVLDRAQILGGHLVLTWLEDARSRLEVRTLTGEHVRDIPLPSLGATGGMKGRPDQDEAYFAFDSFVTPPRVYRTTLSTGATDLWEEADVPVDPSPYTVEQTWFTSADGTRVSMFVVHRKDLVRDGDTPFLLYGYGGFDVNMLPDFRASIYPWLEAGGGYALPNLRGGGEYGEAWHRAGMLENKQNVFDDFIAAAEHLVDEGYTRPDRLAISGGSNGGLLVGAATTQRPDLFEAVVCAVPLLDMLRYHEFGSGRTWMREYGDPDEEEHFRFLHAYSPYHHVRPGTNYPALLMLSADSDDRVDPMHARKMTAALQHATSADHPILLRIEENAGHGGADMVAKYVEKAADTYAFLMHRLGLSPAGVDLAGPGGER